PNIFGKADIFGRRRPTGVDVLQFVGVRDDKVLFIRTTTAIQSNATTMSESPRYVPLNRFSTFSGNVGGTPVFGIGIFFGGAWIPPKGSQAVETQMPPIGMEVDCERIL